MDWNSIVENIKIFFEQPVAIIGCSVGCLLFYTLVFISKTSFGKKSILSVQKKFDELKSKYDENVALLGEKVANLKKEYDDKVAIVEKHAQEVENLIFAISENINNKHVKELIEEYKRQKQEISEEVNDLVNQATLELNDKLQEVQKQLEEYKNSLKDEYEKSITKYQEELDELHKRLENDEVANNETQANE